MNVQHLIKITQIFFIISDVIAMTGIILGAFCLLMLLTVPPLFIVCLPLIIPIFSLFLVVKHHILGFLSLFVGSLIFGLFIYLQVDSDLRGFWFVLPTLFFGMPWLLSFMIFWQFIDKRD